VPIGVEAKRRTLVSYEKWMRSKEGDPKKELLGRDQRRRLKANKGMRQQARERCEELVPGRRQEFSWKRREPWRGLKEAGVELYTELADGGRRGGTEEEMKERVRKTLRERANTDLVIYTDGSVEEGVKNGGAAAVAEWRGEQHIVRKAAGRVCSSYEAETVAMLEAVKMVERLEPESTTVCTDSQALVRALRSDKNTMDGRLEELKDRLWGIAEGRRIVIQWVPGHVGVEGNEWADMAANEARTENQEEVGTSFWSAKKKIYREIRYIPQLEGRLKEVYGEGKIRRKEGEERSVEVLAAQLRAGHCVKSGYYLHRIGRQDNPRCLKCGEEEGKDHWLECGSVQAWRMLWGLMGVSDLTDGRAVGGFLRSAYPEWVG
jgi:ribonuclease HI